MNTSASTPDRDGSVRQLALGDLEHELAATRRVLERVPDEHLAWKPHEKSWSLGQLALHLATLAYWQISIVREDEYDLASAPPPATSGPGSRDDLLRIFDESASALKDAFSSLDDAALGTPWTLRHGEQVLMRQPRGAALRGMGVSHMIHHRGQLTVYLRLLEVPVPGLYGPSADEAVS